MKFFALFLFSASAFAQTNAATAFVTTAPSGSCQTRANLRLKVPSGTLYSCQSGTWTVLSGGGSYSPWPGITGQMTYNNAGAGAGMSGSTWDNSLRAAVFLDSGSNQVINFAASAAGENGCGLFWVNCDGVVPASVATVSGTRGGFIGLNAADGGSTTIVTTGLAGDGGSLISGSGNGASISTALTSGTAGNGGSVFVGVGAGGNCTNGATCIGGDAGNFEITLNAGGTGSTSNGANGVFDILGASGVAALSATYNGAVTIPGTLAISTTTPIGSANAAICWKTSTTLSYCTSVVGVGGTCTCH